MMNSSQADKAVMTSAFVTLGSTVAVSVLPKEHGGMGELPAPRLFIGTGLTYFGLSIMSDFAPSLAGGLATAIAVTALTYYGIPVLDNYFSGEKRNPVGSAALKQTGSARDQLDDGEESNDEG